MKPAAFLKASDHPLARALKCKNKTSSPHPLPCRRPVFDDNIGELFDFIDTLVLVTYLLPYP